MCERVGGVGQLAHFFGLFYGAYRLLDFRYRVVFLEQSDCFVDIALLEQVHSFLRNGVDLALVDARKQICILVHVRQGIVLFFLNGVQLGVILFKLQQVLGILGFEFGQFLLVSLLRLASSYGN